MLCCVKNIFSIYVQKQHSRHTPLWKVYFHNHSCNYFTLFVWCRWDSCSFSFICHILINVNFSFLRTSLSNSVVIYISFRMEMSLIQIKHSLISNLVSGWVIPVPIPYNKFSFAPSASGCTQAEEDSVLSLIQKGTHFWTGMQSLAISS